MSRWLQLFCDGSATLTGARSLLRARAQTAGIDLSRPFFFPPDDPRFDQILTQVKRERAARIARLRRDKKKFAATKARGRRQNITAVHRVKNVSYPLEMEGVE